jgi:Lrp/AsnC family transcriptional regulator, leucine-responsive regulatory protein
MDKKKEIDEIDRRILRVLQQQAEIPNNALAERVGLTPAPCLRRVQRLREQGVLRRYTVEIDPAYLGYQIAAFVEITLRQHTSEVATRFMKAIQNKRQVISCHMVAGDCDFILRVRTRDLAEYRKLIWQDLHRIDGVEKIHSNIVLDVIKE